GLDHGLLRSTHRSCSAKIPSCAWDRFFGHTRDDRVWDGRSTHESASRTELHDRKFDKRLRCCSTTLESVHRYLEPHQEYCRLHHGLAVQHSASISFITKHMHRDRPLLSCGET